MIREPVQTSRALLTWQRPLSSKGRRDRFVVGEFVQEGDTVHFSYTEPEQLREARDAGYRSYPGLLPSNERISSEALQVLMRRLPPKDRVDFPEFLGSFGIASDANISDLSLLAYTGARIKSDDDSFGVTETFDGFDRPFEYMFDIAGVRHYREAFDAAKVGEVVRFRHELGNKHDPNAVELVNQNGTRLGYLNKFQAKPMLSWLQKGSVTASVFRKNGRPDYPRLFVRTDIVPNSAQG